MVYCTTCERHGHSSSSRNAEFCPGCSKCIQSVQNNTRGNENNLKAHTDACPDCDESECKDCNVSVCPTCERCFQTSANSSRGNQNNLQQHMKMHNDRSAQCPACGEQRFRGATGVAIHFESGGCSACRGQDNAEAALYQFVRSNMPNYLNRAVCDVNDVTYLCDPSHVPPQAYQCRYCDRTFNKFGSLTQHIEDKHERNGPTLPARLMLL
mmetsp:Transcript_114967/g.371698  ORF Transcript_114967/g.371698 Transcript_114967/m.371698 type:complete len:211 (+) Transcript_114967:87-719(+)